MKAVAAQKAASTLIQAPLSLWRAERGEGEEGAPAAICCPLGFVAWCQRPVRASMGLRPACFLPSSWSQEETPVGMQGPPEQREVAGIFLAARSPQCPPLGHGGTETPLWASLALSYTLSCNVLFLGKQTRCQTGNSRGSGGPGPGEVELSPWPGL